MIYETQALSFSATAPRDEVIAYCDHCGFAVYSEKDLLLIRMNGDRIHKDCFLDYAEEHLSEFAENAEESEHFGCIGT